MFKYISLSYNLNIHLIYWYIAYSLYILFRTITYTIEKIILITLITIYLVMNYFHYYYSFKNVTPSLTSYNIYRRSSWTIVKPSLDLWFNFLWYYYHAKLLQICYPILLLCLRDNRFKALKSLNKTFLRSIHYITLG